MGKRLRCARMSDELLLGEPQRELNPAIVRTFAILVAVGLLGVLTWNTVIESDPQTAVPLATPAMATESSGVESFALRESPVTPNVMTINGTQMEIFGQPVICGRMNNPEYPE